MSTQDTVFLSQFMPSACSDSIICALLQPLGEQDCVLHDFSSTGNSIICALLQPLCEQDCVLHETSSTGNNFI